MSESSALPWSAADESEPRSPGSQPSPLTRSDGDEPPSQPAEQASGRASPRHDAQPCRAEGEQRDEHLEAVTEPGERLSEQGQGTGAASEGGRADGAVLANGVGTAPAAGRERPQRGDTPGPNSPELGDRGSPSPERTSGALSKQRWHSVLGSSEALSADEAEEFG